jgi:3-hydroxyisobutyrate dehydrogenase
MVGCPSDVHQVVLGYGGVHTAARKRATIIDVTTREPLLAQEIFDAAAAKGLGSLNSPGSGGDVGARSPSLVIMVGDTQQTFGRVLPLLQRLGESVVLEGGRGAGQHTNIKSHLRGTGRKMSQCRN